MTDNDEKRSAKSGTRYAILIGLIIAFGIFIGYGSPATTPVGCEVNWAKCTDVSDLSKHWNGFTRARSECESAADEHAKYRTKWPRSPFQSYIREIENAALTIVDDQVEFQNGFGAWTRMKAFCKYDLQSRKVLNAFVVER